MRRAQLTTAAVATGLALAAIAGCASRPTPVAVAVPAATADAILPPADGYAWSFHQDPYEAKLAYGVPESDQVGLMLSCEPKSGRIALGYPADAGDGASGLTLASGKDRTRYAGKAEADAMASGGGWAEAETTAADRTLSAFARTGDLTVMGRGAPRAVSAKAAETVQVRQFMAACG